MVKNDFSETEALETHYERYHEILKVLTIMSDVFMRNVFKNENVRNILNSGQDFDELPESYVIFITRKAPLGYGLDFQSII